MPPSSDEATEWPAHATFRSRSGADPGLCPMPERARARPFLAGLLSPTHESSPTCYLIKTYCPFLHLKENKFVHLFHRHRHGRAVAACLFFAVATTVQILQPRRLIPSYRLQNRVGGLQCDFTAPRTPSKVQDGSRGLCLSSKQGLVSGR